MGSRIAGLLVPSPRLARAYSPFNRSVGLRRIPEDHIGLSLVCSLIVHALIVVAILPLMDPSSGSGAATWIDLTASEPAGETSGAASTPAARMTPRTGSSASNRSSAKATPAAHPRPATAVATQPDAKVTAPRPSSKPSSAAETSAAQDRLTLAAPGVGLQISEGGLLSIPKGGEPPASPGATSDAPAFGLEPSVVTSEVTLQAAKTLTTVPILDGLPPDQRALATAPSTSAQALPSLTSTPKAESRPVADPQPDKVRPGIAPGSAARLAAETAPMPTTPSSPFVEPTRDAPLPRQPTTSSADSVPVQDTASIGEVIPALSSPAEPGEPNRSPVLTTAGDLPQMRRPTEAAPEKAKITSGAHRARVSARELETEDSTRYAPPAPPAVTLTSPADGLVVTPDDPPVIVVEGRVENQSTTRVWLVVNDHRISVEASEGRFRKVLPMTEPALRVWAETAPAGKPADRSQIVLVRAIGQRTPSALLVMEWPKGTQDLDVEVSALWRPHPDRLDDASQPVRLAGIPRPSGAAARDIFWLRNIRAGVYTMIVRYHGLPPKGEVHPTLYVPDRDGLAARVAQPIQLDGIGKAILARVLLPQGVLWEQDAWFSGFSDSADTVTKFRFPEGITWVEKKSDLR